MVGVGAHPVELVVDVAQRLRELGQPLRLADEDESLDARVLERLRVRRPAADARGREDVVVDDLVAHRLRGVHVLARDLARQRDVAREHADVILRLRELLAEVPQVADRQRLGAVRQRLHEQVRAAGLDAGDEPRHVGEQALQPRLDAVGVERRAAADHREVVAAGLGHPRHDVRQRGVTLVDDDLPTVDPAPVVAPGGEDVRSVEELLVQPGATREPDVRERRDVDGVRTDPGRGGARRRPALAHVGEVAEHRRLGSRGRLRGRCVAALLVARVAAAARRRDQRQAGEHHCDPLHLRSPRSAAELDSAFYHPVGRNARRPLRCTCPRSRRGPGR